MNTNRRGFLALLPSLAPLFAWLFGKPATSTPVKLECDWRGAANYWKAEAERYAKNSDYWRSRSIKWIPVTERLPECSRISRRLVVLINGQVTMDWFTDSYCSGPHWSYNSSTPMGITHWAELPEPPRPTGVGQLYVGDEKVADIISYRYYGRSVSNSHVGAT